jgi:hypothetical protein
MRKFKLKKVKVSMNCKIYFEFKCTTLDKQIDELAYQLYGLSEEEITIVEEE